MEKRNVQRRAGKIAAAAALAAAGLVGLSSSSAKASLVIDLRASGASAGTTISADKKTVTVPGANAQILVDVYARLTGANTVQTVGNYDSEAATDPFDPNSIPVNDTRNDEALQILVGSFKSSNGGLLLTSVGNNIGPAYSGNSSHVGALVDLDGDTDLDIGGTGTDEAPMWAGRANSPAYATQFTKDPANGGGSSKGISGPSAYTDVASAKSSILSTSSSEIYLGQLSMKTTSATGNTSLTFVVRPSGDATALWFEDGSASGLTPATGAFSVSPLTVTSGSVPEPASLGLLGIASVGLLARRRATKA